MRNLITHLLFPLTSSPITFLSVFLSVFFTMPTVTNAAIYKFYDENGNVVFADQPGPNAVLIEKKDVQTVKTPRSRQTVKLTPSEQDKQKLSYDEFKISSPGNGATIRENNGNINVDITLKPQLKTKLKHKIVLLLDGKAVSEAGSATSFTLHNVDRGQHSLSAKIIDSNEETFKTAESITIYLRRFSILERTPESETPNNTIPRAKRAPQAMRAPQYRPPPRK